MNHIVSTAHVASPRMADYDESALGPLFAVSDEGSAALAVIEAAYGSAKAKAIPSLRPLDLGVLLDGERMTSAGEVPIGPDEYHTLVSATRGRLLCTTNVGVRVNTRLAQLLPEFAVDDLLSDPKRLEQVFATFTPFLHTPDSAPRPLTARLLVEPRHNVNTLRPLLATIDDARTKGKLAPSSHHRFSLLVVFPDAITTPAQVRAIETAIDAAAALQLLEVAIDGDLTDAARKRLGLQGLLNVLDVATLRHVLSYAHQRGVRVSYRYQIDVESAARTIWSGLHAARTHGFVAGKYGLVPMTLGEQRAAIELLTRWSAGWTAIPAFYVDTPLVTDDDVLDDTRCAEAAMMWLRAARGAGATLVLFDCPDRITPRRLVRQENIPGDVGVLSLADVDRILDFARELGVKILWSGGVTGAQAFELAKRRVFGIFSTSSTAKKIAVTAAFDRDPRLASENEPTEFGVRRIHAVTQGGFLSTALKNVHDRLAGSIEQLSQNVLAAEADAAQSKRAMDALDVELVQGWSMLGKTSAPSTSNTRRVTQRDWPVPADAVRVFRGFKQPDLEHPKFCGTLGSVFMPMTVQMQRLYGLTAYLPAVLPPEHGEGLPDEIALVFYRTQDSYESAKRCVGARAYGALHDVVFDMPSSPSGFPRLFSGSVDTNQPYHLFNTSVDWQTGSARLFVGRVPVGKGPDVMMARVREVAMDLQGSRGSLDATIFCASNRYVLWWEHSPTALPTVDRFGKTVETVFEGCPRLVRMPAEITEPYAGLVLNPAGEFLCMQFQRVGE